MCYHRVRFLNPSGRILATVVLAANALLVGPSLSRAGGPVAWSDPSSAGGWTDHMSNDPLEGHHGKGYHAVLGEVGHNQLAVEEAGEAEDEDAACKRLNRLLFPRGLSERTGVSVEGWLDQGFTWNPANPADRFNGPLCHNDRANEYQLNQLYLLCERPVDSESEKLSFGFRGDLVYGTDAFLFQSLGLDDRTVPDHDSRFYKLAFPQLYVEGFVPIGPGIKVQIGKFFTLVGYENGLAPDDFFYSHTLAYNGIAFSLTGVLLTTDLTDQISTSHGFHRGSDVWEDNNNELGYIGYLSWTSKDEKTTIYSAVQFAPEQDERADWQNLSGHPGPDAPGRTLNRTNFSATLEHQLTKRLQYVFNHDYFFQSGAPEYGFDDAEAYAFSQYLYYDVNDRVRAGARLEILRDETGFLVYGFRSENPAAAGLYTNLTFGLNIRQGNCILWRPEIRWDWQNRDDPADLPAFRDGRSNHQFLFSLDMVVRF